MDDRLDSVREQSTHQLLTSAWGFSPAPVDSGGASSVRLVMVVAVEGSLTSLRSLRSLRLVGWSY